MDSVFQWFLARHSLLERIKHASHEDGAEEVLKWQEGVVYAKQGRHEAEVDEEDNNAEVDDGERCCDDSAVGQQEDDAGCQTALGHAANATTCITITSLSRHNQTYNLQRILQLNQILILN